MPPLRNQPGRAVRRLSPLAVRTSGPLPRFGTLAYNGRNLPYDRGDPEHNDAGPGPNIDPASADTAAMPAEIIADAAEPATASGNVDSTKNNDTQSSPLTSESSCKSDRDDDRDNINVETGLSSVQDKIQTRTSKPSMRDVRCAYVEEAYDEEAPTCCTQEQDHIIAEARNNMTTEECERGDRRAENVCIAKSMHVQEDELGEPSQAKGKGVDPRNWGNIHLDNLEIDPQLQQEMLTEFYACHNPDKHQTSPDSTTAPADLENERLPASKNGDETDGSSDEQTKEVSHEEICAYIKDKKRLLFT
ncbi:hypothetical protein H0H87_007565 [Tephrocybe sp. NHM501043]|nr:hypothetical protein H0H87_007565 [Tephrocybe sp. NHM501043]